MYLPFAQMAYNATVHDTTGETPNKVVFGEQLRMPIDVMTPTVAERVPLPQSEYVRELEEDMRYCNERVRAATLRMAKCHNTSYDIWPSATLQLAHARCSIAYLPLIHVHTLIAATVPALQPLAS